MMKKIGFIGMMTIVAVAVCAVEIWAFPKHAALFKPSPEAVRSFMQCRNDALEFRRTEEIKRASVYTQVKLPSNAGIVGLESRYRSDAPGFCRVNFNLANAGNGSAGRQVIPLPAAGEWQNVCRWLEVPSGAVSMQLIWELPSQEKPSSEFALQEVRIDFVPDRASIPFRSVRMDEPPSSWPGEPLRHFYDSNSGETAKVQSELRIAHDRDRLYVGFIAYEPMAGSLAPKRTERDRSVWTDDCVELFFFDPAIEKGYQFGVNSINTQFDALLTQKMAGDPWRADISWNGDWDSRVFRFDDRYEAIFSLPWKLFGANGPADLKFNAARERIVVPELSQWNAAVGKFQDVDKYARMTFSPQGGEIIRYRNLEVPSFQVKRSQTVFKEVLSPDRTGQYRVGAWYSGFFAIDYPEALRKKYSDEDFDRWQRELLEACGQAGMCGPLFPWTTTYFIGGLSVMREANRRHGMKFPYYFNSSAVHGRVLKQSKDDVISYMNRIDSAGKEYADAAVQMATALKQSPEMNSYLDLVDFFLGIDEPTNNIRRMYNRTMNPTGKELLDRFEAELKRDYGFGKFGLPDREPPGDTIAFERIAFWRCWNDRFAETVKRTTKALHDHFPGIPYLGYSRNTTAGVCTLDIALTAPGTDWVGCDPYPTATASFYGFSRALYHTGFSVKMLRDLAPDNRIAVIPQGFIYHGRRPEPEDLREWASQSLKNGASVIFWYASQLAPLTMTAGFNAILNINRQIADLPALELPNKTVSAIYYSDYDCWGLDDAGANAAYTVYAILGEHINCNFRFISNSLLKQKRCRLQDYKIIYVPRLRFTDPELTAEWKSFVENGGTLVVFDPEFLRFNIDGTAVPERTEWSGGMTPRQSAVSSLRFGDGRLTVTRGPLDPAPFGYDFAALPQNARALAVYDDGKPAVIERPCGKGRLILSGIMPFGTGSAAAEPGAWRDFFAMLADSVGEERNLPIWKFRLPETSGIAIVPRIQ